MLGCIDRQCESTRIKAERWFCSDIYQAYYKSRIRKNRTKHIPIRGIKEDEVPQILLQKVIVDKDLVGAEKALLALSGLKRYKKSLRLKIEQEHFLDHLRKYIAMYQTDCPWEVSATNRYTITTYEASVTARRRIRQGDSVKYLTGTLVPLTNEESDDLDLTNRNFSIVVSSRKKNSSIFLGPARFANHDCDANGRLVTRGVDGMEVVAIKNIEVGDEITVSYGDDYFGPDNMDCLCHTCEMLERNGWTSKAAILDPDSRSATPLQEPRTVPASRGLKRKREEGSPSQSSCGPPSSKHVKVMQSPSKLQHCWSPPSTSDEDSALPPSKESSESIDRLHPPVPIPEGGDNLSPPHSPLHLQNPNPIQPVSIARASSAPAEMTGKPVDFSNRSSDSLRPEEALHESKITSRLLGKLSVQAPVSPAPTSPSSSGSASEGGASHGQPIQGQTADKAITIKVENVETTKLEADADTIIVTHSRSDLAKIKGQPSPDRAAIPERVSKYPETAALPVPHVISTLSTTTVTKDVHARDSSNPTTETNVLPSIEPGSTSATVATLTVHPVTGTIRIAGDYILTRKLLAQPHDRWVQCHNEKCYGFFIQPNGYQTRRECPRCERHSILYGFPWPKTDPDPRKLLERKSQGSGRGKKTGAPATEYSAYRRKGRCGKGTWVEGGGDEEERVMDHRTIHRFVLPEEERELTRKGLLKEAELARAAGDHALALLEAKMRAGSRGLNGTGTGTESAARDGSESGSATPDEARRRSNRFVTRPVGVYRDKF